MRNRKGAIAAIGVTAAALILAACSGGSDASSDATGAASPSSDAVVTVHGSEPQNALIPTNTNETGGGNVVDAMWTGLVSYNVEDGHPELAVAESITPNDDYTLWTIKLNEGWTFHDGTPVLAKNFVDAWNYGALFANGQMNQYFFSPDGLNIKGYDEVGLEESTGTAMSGLTVVDDYTFTVELAGPNSLFETIVGYTAFAPMPDSFFADPAAFEAHPVGNGPFEFVSRTPSVSIVLKAYADYAGPRKPQVQNVEFKIYQSLDAAYADVVANNLDVLDAMPTSALAGGVWQQDLAGRFIEKPLSSIFQSISIPMYDERFQNADVRKAISRALDRVAVIDVAFGGTREPASGWVPPGNDGYEPDVCGENCVYDADAAKALLESAGGFDGTLTIAYNADGGHQEWIDAACVSIGNALGIECQGLPFPEFGAFRQEVVDRKMTGLFRTGWQADYPSIQNFLAPLYATGASANDGDYSNPEFDALIREAVQVPAAEANAKYNAAERILAQDMPVIPLWYSKLQGAWSDKINEPAFNWQGRVDLLSLSVK